MAEPHRVKHAELRELADADRAYRAAYRELTSAGGFQPSSFRALLATVRRLDEVVRQLEERER